MPEVIVRRRMIRLMTLFFWLPFLLCAVSSPFEDGQEVLAQRPDGTWQQAMIDGDFDGTGYPVQFMEPPYGNQVLPPERIRLDPAKGTLDEQLERAFPEIPKWTHILAVRKEDGRPHWALLTKQSGAILKIAWDDRSGRQKIGHKDILESRPPAPAEVLAAERERQTALHALEYRRGRDRHRSLSIGYYVRAMDSDDGRWYAARILKKSGDSYEIRWEDGADVDEYRQGFELVSP